MLNLTSNSGKLTRFILRRDRISISIWLLCLVLITLVIASAFTNLYPTPQDAMAIAETLKNPAITAMLGPAFGIDNYTYGAIMAHQMLLFTALAVAIMSIFLVVRHTRKDEENARIEVIRSLPVGRLSTLTATGAVAAGVNILLFLVVGFGLFALGIETMDLNGSLLYGAALGATGLFFAAATALFVQLSDSSRGAVGYSFLFLILAYLVRAVGDTGSETLSWLSPLGWILQSQVYVNNYWWPVLLTAAAAVVVFIVAMYLNSIRDLEAGFIPAKPGRRNASPFLQSTLGLGVRLLRTVIMAWAIGMYILGASYGSIMGDLESFFSGNEMYEKMLVSGAGLSLAEQFLPTLMVVIAMLGTIPPLIIVLRLRAEEKRNRTEHLLARSVSRTRLLGSYLGISVVVSVIIQFLSAAGLWSAAATVMVEPFDFSTVVYSSLAYLPAIWVLMGAAVLLIGIIPKATGFTWLYLGYSFFVVYLGNILQTPEWMAKISPFGHIPKVPVEDFSITEGLIITGIAIIFMVIGFIGFNKRDVQG